MCWDPLTQIVDELPPPRFPCSQLEPTPIDTRGFQSLLSLVGNTNNDSFDLYYGLFMYNPVSGCSLSRGPRCRATRPCCGTTHPLTTGPGGTSMGGGP